MLPPPTMRSAARAAITHKQRQGENMTQPLYYEYAVQPGETITTIIHKLYG
jgi:hypothetical protein